MEIQNDIEIDGEKFHLIYRDVDSFDDLPYEKCRQHYGVCFYKGKIILGYHDKVANHWSLIGGTIETDEKIDDALIREVKEESNMRVIRHQPIGYQEMIAIDGTSVFQLRSYCEVEPIGNFVSDPAGAVSKLKFIDPKDFKRFVDWGAVGDRIISRAVKMHEKR